MSTFGDALKILKSGGMVARTNWNGKDMYLKIHQPPVYDIITFQYIVLKTADESVVPWTASQTDLLTDDWVRVYPDRKNTPI